MRRPPPSIAIIAGLFAAVGCLDVVRGIAPLFQVGRLASDDVLVIGIAVAAWIGAIFVAFGHNWARWLLAAWMGFHVAVGVGGGLVPLVAHVLIFGLLVFFLFRPRVAGHFRPAPAAPTSPQS